MELGTFFHFINDVLLIVRENLHNFVKNDLNSKQQTLEDKADFINEYSKWSRDDRKITIAVANRKGEKLAHQQIMLVRKKEELARRKANCLYSKRKWRMLKYQRASKNLMHLLEARYNLSRS